MSYDFKLFQAISVFKKINLKVVSVTWRYQSPTSVAGRLKNSQIFGNVATY
jgi:hypothetical protein